MVFSLGSMTRAAREVAQRCADRTMRKPAFRERSLRPLQER